MKIYFYSLVDATEKRFLNKEELDSFFKKCIPGEKYTCGHNENSPIVEILKEDYIEKDYIFGLIYKNKLIKNDFMHALTYKGNNLPEVNIKNITFFIINKNGEIAILQESKSFHRVFKHLLNKEFNFNNWEIAFIPSENELLDELGKISRMKIFSGEKSKKNINTIGRLESAFNFDNGDVAEFTLDVKLEKVNKTKLKDTLNGFLNHSKKIMIFGESDEGDVILDYISKKISKKREVNIDHLLEENIENVKKDIYKEIRKNM